MSAPSERGPGGAANLALRVDAAFRAFVGDPRFPCLAGKGTVQGGGYRLGVYGALGSARSARALALDLATFVTRPPAEKAGLRAFVAVFPARAPTDERAYERRLWAQLRHLHERDEPAARWDPAVSADPADPHFAFSFAGCAMFVIGLHPGSSRLARRFRWPALVFNPSCFDNLARHLAPFGIAPDAIPTTLNIFMNVVVLPSGELRILPPRSRAGDYVLLRAEMDVVAGVTACSAELSNNGRFKPIDVEILEMAEPARAATATPASA